MEGYEASKGCEVTEGVKETNKEFGIEGMRDVPKWYSQGEQRSAVVRKGLTT